MATEIESEIQLFKDVHLGSGAFGIVCKARYNLLPCAAKLLHPTFLSPGNWAADKFMQECSFLSSLQHPHIVQFLGIQTDPVTGQAVLLMELMEESLTTFLKSSNQLVPLHIQVDICHDIALALHYLHSKGIIHRDLSSNNILLIGGCRAKITDFGMSKLTLNVSSNLSSLTQVPGCPVYMPPEAWINPPIYTEKLDVFSFGVLILQISTRQQPNPGPLESLIPDERSPTGFLKLPVPEIERRAEHIALVPLNYPLKDLMMKCFSDKQDNRPCSRDLCIEVEAIKGTEVYNESSKVKLNTRDDSIASSLCSDSSNSSSNLSDSGLVAEMHSLKKSLSQNQMELTKLRSEASMKDTSIKSLTEQLATLKSATEKETASKQLMTSNFLKGSVEERTVQDLSPEVLSMLKTDPNFSQSFNVDYNRDQVTFYYHPQKVGGERQITLFLQMYQRLFNTGELRVNFVPIPESFPKDLLPMLLTSCAQHHNECVFQLLESIHMIKILSKSAIHNQLSTQLVTDLLNVSISIPGGRKIVAKICSVVDQKCDVLVCSAVPKLSVIRGLAATVNTMSNFELEKHCSSHVEKHGFLKHGEILHVPASGSLMCKWLILAVGPDSSYTGIGKAAGMERVMKTVNNAILDKAEKLKAESIAHPLLGSLDIEQKFSTRVILQVMLGYRYHSVRNIYMCVVEKRFFLGTVEAFIELGAFWTKKEYDAIKLGTSKSCKQQ